MTSIIRPAAPRDLFASHNSVNAGTLAEVAGCEPVFTGVSAVPGVTATAGPIMDPSKLAIEVTI
jgi:hypothetical protein